VTARFGGLFVFPRLREVLMNSNASLVKVVVIIGVSVAMRSISVRSFFDTRPV